MTGVFRCTPFSVAGGRKVQLGARHLGTYGPERRPARVVGEMGPAEGAFVLKDYQREWLEGLRQESRP